MRRPVVAGNWKVNKAPDEAVSFVNQNAKSFSVKGVEVILCVPSVSLWAVKQALEKTDINISAQNMHYEKETERTGEITGEMLVEMGVKHVLVGHSERREHFGETDEIINVKTKKALELGITPIVCIGETARERENDKTNDVLESQLINGLKGISDNEKRKLIIAYEPVWAIGKKAIRAAKAEDAEAACKFVRGIVGDDITILYGGSVKPENASELFGQPNIDGGLVGGASLLPSFADVVKAGAK